LTYSLVIGRGRPFSADRGVLWNGWVMPETATRNVWVNLLAEATKGDCSKSDATKGYLHRKSASRRCARSRVSSQCRL